MGAEWYQTVDYKWWRGRDIYHYRHDRQGKGCKRCICIYCGKGRRGIQLRQEGKEDGVVIVGDGSGSVVKVTSSFVTLKNLRITHSGDRHDKLDGAISLENVKHCEINTVHIDDCLFGIDFQNTSNSKIINNYITSKDSSIGLRGDGIRLWYSNDNLIENNTLYKSRDIVVWYSHN
ncbi:MAG: hypothetical protein DSZ23_04410, partial [Thermodesulfatator sp.]